MEFIKNNECIFDDNLILKLSSKFNMHPDVIKLLFARNIKTEEEIMNFLNPPETNFFDPFLCK